MTLRSCGRDTVPMIGPRSRAVAAPHTMGKRGFAPGAGCDVSRIWSVRLGRVIAGPKKPTARRFDGPNPHGCQSIVRPRRMPSMLARAHYSPPAEGYNGIAKFGSG